MTLRPGDLHLEHKPLLEVEIRKRELLVLDIEDGRTRLQKRARPLSHRMAQSGLKMEK